MLKRPWTGDRQIQMLVGEVEMPDSTLDWKYEEDTRGKFDEAFITCVMRKMGSNQRDDIGLM